MREPYITIFTPTYNRAKLLKRLYESLCRQKEKNFEWIIVDDASADDTERVVSGWIDSGTGDFEIRYYKQEHGGKHRALNKGFLHASGKFFFIVDSDDYLTDDATAKIETWGKKIENDDTIAGVAGLRANETGIIGGKHNISGEWVDASNFERIKYNLYGDKAEILKTDIIKRYPFPVFEGEYFVTEAVCWDAIAADGYKLRWYNEPIYICEYLEGGLTKTGANELEGHRKNYRGYCYYIKQCIQIVPRMQSITNFREYNKTARKLKISLRQRMKDLDMAAGRYLSMYMVEMPALYSVRVVKKIIKTMRKN